MQKAVLQNDGFYHCSISCGDRFYTVVLIVENNYLGLQWEYTRSPLLVTHELAQETFIWHHSLKKAIRMNTCNSPVFRANFQACRPDADGCIPIKMPLYHRALHVASSGESDVDTDSLAGTGVIVPLKNQGPMLSLFAPYLLHTPSGMQFTSYREML